MRQSFSVPAAYARYLVSVIAIGCADVVRDADYKGDEDERIRQFGKVPSDLFDPDLRGVVTITVEDAIDMSTDAEAVIAAQEAYIAAFRRWKKDGPRIKETWAVIRDGMATGRTDFKRLSELLETAHEPATEVADVVEV